MQFHKAIYFFCKMILICSLWGSAHAEQTTKENAKETEPTTAESAAALTEYSGKQNREWEQAQAKLGAAKGRMDAQMSVVQNLIMAKSGLKGKELSDKIEELKREHLKLRKSIDDYNELNEEFLTRFPERGRKESRLYKRVKSKSLKAYEEDFTVHGSVNKLHNKILKQYSKTKNDVKTGDTRAEMAHKNNADKSEKSDQTSKKEVTDQIILGQ